MSILKITAVEIFVVHFFIGFGPCVAWSIYCSVQNKRRRIFRFGGDTPLSFGSKIRWSLWFMLGYVFAFGSSCHPNIGARMYVEMALSLYQALAITLGLFIADRLGMIFEPASYWVIEKAKNGNSAKPISEDKPEKIWIKETVDDVTESVVESAKDATDKVVASATSTIQNGRGFFHHLTEAIEQKKQAELKNRAEAEANERRRLSELLRGY